MIGENVIVGSYDLEQDKMNVYLPSSKVNVKLIFSIIYLYSSTSTNWCWCWRGLKRAPRNDLDKLIQRAFLPICAGTTTIIC